MISFTQCPWCIFTPPLAVNREMLFLNQSLFGCGIQMEFYMYMFCMCTEIVARPKMNDGLTWGQRADTCGHIVDTWGYRADKLGHRAHTSGHISDTWEHRADISGHRPDIWEHRADTWGHSADRWRHCRHMETE